MAKSDSKRLFALSIDEQIEWAAIDRFRSPRSGNYEESVQSWGVINLPKLKPGEQYALHDLLDVALTSLGEIKSESLARPDAIGVSSIGSISNHCLGSIQRKPWGPRSQNDEFVIDFRELFTGVFGVDSVPLLVQNDATAKALAEIEEHVGEGRDTVKPSPFVYITIDEGMNCGIVFRIRDIDAVLHPNIGHSFPPVHPGDEFRDADKSGCATHTNCYEGLASFARFRRRWGLGELNDFDPDHPQWTLQAHYIAHACLTICSIIGPRLIAIGGCLSLPWLIERVRSRFEVVGGDYLRHVGRPVAEFIVAGKLDSQIIPLKGAVTLARQCLLNNVVKINSPSLKIVS